MHQLIKHSKLLLLQHIDNSFPFNFSVQGNPSHAAPPTITHLGFTHGPMSSTLTCISTGSPATNVTWMRDGQPLTIDGTTYQLTQMVTNRRMSTYENVLIINTARSNIINYTYNCTIINALGTVSKTLTACKLSIPNECVHFDQFIHVVLK